MKLQNNIKIVTNIEIHNQAQDDMIKKFGFFVTYFLFWMKKYDKWYTNRIKELKESISKEND